MPKKSTKQKSNVVLEGMVTRLRSKSMTPTTHQNSPTSSSKYLSRAVPSRCHSLRSAKRFKEREEKSVNESTPMMKDARDSNESTSEQESEHHSTNGLSAYCNAALDNLLASVLSPSPVVSTATPLRYQSQVAMNPSTLRPAMRSATIVEHNDRTVDRGIATTKGASNIEEVTSKVVTQNQNPEDCHPHSPPVPNRDLNPGSPGTIASNVIGEQIPPGEAKVVSNVIEERLEESANNPNPSIGLTEIANMWVDDASGQDEVGSFPLDSLVTVHGYRVKEAWAPLLRNILEKHGDIAMNCTMTIVEIRSCFLELICEVIRTLQETDFEHLTGLEIKKMLDIVDHCRGVSVEVGWLHERLDAIIEAKQLVKNCSTLKEAKNKNNQVIEELSRELEELKENISLKKKKLNAARGEAKRIRQTASDALAKVSGFVTRSLVDGII